MDAPAIPATAAPEESLLTGVHAYVLDAESEGTLKRAANNLALRNFEVRQGDVRTAEKDLKTKRSPAVLFVDVSKTAMIADAMQQLSQVCEPQLRVIAIGRENDVGLYRELIAMGVTDYVFKPLTTELIEKVLARNTSTTGIVDTRRQGKLVVVTGARGGVGTSSVACNVASYLAEKAARRVVLVDLDTTAGIQALLFNVKPNAGLSEALESPSRIDDLLLERATINVSERLDVLASEMPLDGAQTTVSEAVATLIERLRKAYYYVIVDMPRLSTAVSAGLLNAANLRLLVTEATLVGARDVTRMPVTAGNQRTILIHNKSGRPGDLSDADFAAALRRDPDIVIPYDSRKFGGGMNLGKPAWRGGGSVENAIAKLVTELSGQGASVAKTGLLAKLLGR